MLLTSHGLGHYWKTHYADHTFRNVYRWNAFDISLLVPYFLVMIILAFYGIHRYQLVWLYYRNKRNEAHSDEPAATFAEEDLPFVTIQLPIYNEQFVIDRLLDACCRLDYPRDRFEIQLLDDSTDETVDVASAMVARFAAGTQGLAPQPVYYLHRTNRHGYKAGALEEGLRTSKGELVAIFDADFVPPPTGSAGRPPLRRTRRRHGPDPLDAPQSQLQLPHPGRSHPPRRPLRPRTRRPLPRRRLLQLQRHRRHVASPGHRRSRRLAARHPHRGHRPQLPRPAERLEVQVPPGRRVPRRAPHRDDRLQDPAGALGQGPHPGRQEDPPQHPPLGHLRPPEARSLVSPHRQHQLPAHDRALASCSCPP